MQPPPKSIIAYYNRYYLNISTNMAKYFPFLRIEQ